MQVRSKWPKFMGGFPAVSLKIVHFINLVMVDKDMVEESMLEDIMEDNKMEENMVVEEF